MRKPPIFPIVMIIVGAVLLNAPDRSHAQTRRQSDFGNHFTLTVVPGPEYKASATLFLFIKIPLYPQIACWLENPDGQFIDTIYVTSKGAKHNFFSAPSKGRPEALPVWYHLQEKQSDIADAVSGATAAGSAEHEYQLPKPLKPGRYIVKLEINRSYDYNESFTRLNSGVNGQPSLVYRAEFELGKGPGSVRLVAVGVGSIDGADGSVRPGLDGITTALELIDNAQIEWSGN